MYNFRVIRIKTPKVCVLTNSYIVVNAVNGKMTVSKDIINLVKNIRWLLETILVYCCRNTKKEVNAIFRKAHV